MRKNTLALTKLESARYAKEGPIYSDEEDDELEVQGIIEDRQRRKRSRDAGDSEGASMNRSTKHRRSASPIPYPADPPGPLALQHSLQPNVKVVCVCSDLG